MASASGRRPRSVCGRHELQLTEEIRFPHSLGLLYSAFTAFLGFEVNEGEYKVMGMAPYGTPRYVDKVRRLVRLLATARSSSTSTTSPSTTRRHGPTAASSKRSSVRRVRPNALLHGAHGYPSYFGPKPGNFGELAAENQRYADIAASIQVVTEEIVLGWRARRTQRQARRGCAWPVGSRSTASQTVESSAKRRYRSVRAACGRRWRRRAWRRVVRRHALLGEPRRFVMDHASWGQAHARQRSAGTADAGLRPARSTRTRW